jgi:hypothetical protein
MTGTEGGGGGVEQPKKEQIRLCGTATLYWPVLCSYGAADSVKNHQERAAGMKYPFIEE